MHIFIDVLFVKPNTFLPSEKSSMLCFEHCIFVRPAIPSFKKKLTKQRREAIKRYQKRKGLKIVRKSKNGSVSLGEFVQYINEYINESHLMNVWIPSSLVSVLKIKDGSTRSESNWSLPAGFRQTCHCLPKGFDCPILKHIAVGSRVFHLQLKVSHYEFPGAYQGFEFQASRPSTSFHEGRQPPVHADQVII